MDNIATIALMRHGGSHLIRPIVANLGFDIIEPGNFHAPLDQAVGPTIVFLRDPRNRMAATLRWWRTKPRKNDLLTSNGNTNDEQLVYLLRNQNFLNEMLQWANIWCNWSPPHLIVRFESMNVGRVKVIAKHLGLSDDKERDERVFNEVYEKGRTYTGNRSNWRDYFGPLSTQYWENNGGRDLMNLMGYR